MALFFPSRKESRNDSSLTATKRQKEAFRASLVARSCWLIIHVGILVLLLRRPSSPIREELDHGRVMYPLLYFTLFTANVVLYVICSLRKPGYVKTLKDAYSSASMASLPSVRCSMGGDGKDAAPPAPPPPPSPGAPRSPAASGIASPRLSYGETTRALSPAAERSLWESYDNNLYEDDPQALRTGPPGTERVTQAVRKIGGMTMGVGTAAVRGGASVVNSVGAAPSAALRIYSGYERMPEPGAASAGSYVAPSGRAMGVGPSTAAAAAPPTPGPAPPRAAASGLFASRPRPATPPAFNDYGINIEMDSIGAATPHLPPPPQSAMGPAPPEPRRSEPTLSQSHYSMDPESSSGIYDPPSRALSPTRALSPRPMGGPGGAFSPTGALSPRDRISRDGELLLETIALRASAGRGAMPLASTAAPAYPYSAGLPPPGPPRRLDSNRPDTVLVPAAPAPRPPPGPAASSRQQGAAVYDIESGGGAGGSQTPSPRVAGEPVTPQGQGALPPGGAAPVTPGTDCRRSDLSKTPRKRKSVNAQHGKYCSACGIWQPLRVKHCYDCGRCVTRFDHHCMWIGNCVGGRNHSHFLAFLSTQLALALWTVVQLFASFESSRRADRWLSRNTALLLSVFVLILANIFLTSLWIQHVWLMFTNQTSYEQMKGTALWYLSSVPDNVYPFSKGLGRNVWGFCGGKVELDTMPPPTELRNRSERQTWYDNAHCSLC